MDADRPDPSTESETSALRRYLAALKKCRPVAARVFDKYPTMFPGGVMAMCSLDASLANSPASIRATAMESHLKFLETMDPLAQHPGVGPGLNQLDDVSYPAASSTTGSPGRTQSTFQQAAHAQSGIGGMGRGLNNKRRQAAPVGPAAHPANQSAAITWPANIPPMPPSFGECHLPLAKCRKYHDKDGDGKL